jgi:hypothetical protein
MFDWHMVNPPLVWFGRAGAGEELGAGPLILIPVGFLLVTFLAFLVVGRGVATLRLSA